MYIVSMSGVVLAVYDRWDVRSVAKAEQFISEKSLVIWKCELLETGVYVITVRS